MKKRIITVELSRTYTFDEKEYPVDKYDSDTLADMAYDWFMECHPDIFIDEEND